MFLHAPPTVSLFPILHVHVLEFPRGPFDYERELMHVCNRHGIGVKTWSGPKAGARIAFRGRFHIATLGVESGSGYLLYRFGISHEAGIVQPASKLISDLLRWSVLGSVALIIALTGGSISSERGIMADSVLSRGISRYQYFLGKWHARLIAVVGTFSIMGLLALTGSFIRGGLKTRQRQSYSCQKA